MQFEAKLLPVAMPFSQFLLKVLRLIQQVCIYV